MLTANMYLELTPDPNTSQVYDYDHDYDYDYLLCEHQDLSFATIGATVLYCLVSLLSLVGNSLVLWVLVRYENLESLTNVFILNLCLSDLTFSCLLPFWTLEYHGGWGLGDFPCKLLTMVFSISLYSSIFFLTVMTVHRYVSVVWPLSSMNFNGLRCRGLVTAGVWAASVLSSVPEAVFHRVLSSHCSYSAERWFVVSVYQHNAFFLLSLGTILFCYMEILRTLFRSPARRRHRTVRLIFAIVAAYFLSWAPYNLVMFLQTLLKLGLVQGCRAKRRLDYAVLVCRCVAFSHCCVNPVLYVFVGIKFRRHLKSLLRRCWLCQPSPPCTPHSGGAFNYEGASFY
ncbi:chemokine XC receptor 1 [Erinaceus europaeus]|uniref:Chemokine XC receptor 1 n=1 Tax=Erinaceus europaeus TaxID=9365 RepID=A0A1S3A9H1_ERIEU|nr:chemokine XC receptor 1 [Erinaceus europaeus]